MFYVVCCKKWKWRSFLFTRLAEVETGDNCDEGGEKAEGADGEKEGAGEEQAEAMGGDVKKEDTEVSAKHIYVAVFSH